MELGSPAGRALGNAVSPLFYRVRGWPRAGWAPVHRFRVDQETRSRLRIRVVAAAEYTDAVRLRITSGILVHGDPTFEVAWKVVDAIAATSSGKFRFTVSHVGKGESSPPAES